MSGDPDQDDAVHVSDQVFYHGKDIESSWYETYVVLNLRPLVRPAIAGDAQALKHLVETPGACFRHSLACSDSGRCRTGPYRAIVLAKGSARGGRVNYVHPAMPMELIDLLHHRYNQYKGIDAPEANAQRAAIVAELRVPYRHVLALAAEGVRNHIAGQATLDSAVTELARQSNDAARELLEQQRAVLRELTA